MKSRYNAQLVRVQMTEYRAFAKMFKYIMLMTITGCCVQSAFILTRIAERLL
jgi:hypothetical protein